jgi:hypothetical protein
MDKPIFADAAPALGGWKRTLLGLACAAILLGILTIVCHVMESFRDAVKKEGSPERFAIPAQTPEPAAAPK